MAGSADGQGYYRYRPCKFIVSCNSGADVLSCVCVLPGSSSVWPERCVRDAEVAGSNPVSPILLTPFFIDTSHKRLIILFGTFLEHYFVRWDIMSVHWDKAANQYIVRFRNADNRHRPPKRDVFGCSCKIHSATR